MLLFWSLAEAGPVPDGEVQDRRVDQAALQAQESAELKLKSLIKKYKNTAKEPALMMRLADIYHQSAEMEFRVAHGKAFTTKKPIKLVKYNKILSSLIEITTNLIQLHPDFFAIDQCLFMSAKAHEELGHKELARTQYLQLIHKHPDSSQATATYMALAELAIEKNLHVEAISYLTEVERNPKSPYYPFAIHKLAWSNYNLKRYEEASSWIEKSVRYYDKVIERANAAAQTPGAPAAQASDLAMRENILMDAVLFFNEGFEAGLPNYELKSALDTFRNLEKGPLLGKMNLRFAKLLRAHRKDQDLFSWEQTIMKKEPKRPETIQVVTTLFEHLWNQSLYDQMLAEGKDIEQSYKALDPKDRETDGAIEARKLLLEAANKFHEMGRNNKNAEKTTLILNNLAAIYAVFLNILPEKDPRAPEAHYNLAESLFLGKDFEKATEHYNWILAHFNPGSKLDKKEIALKAISSRYEVLRQSKLIPLDLAARRMDDNGDPTKIRNLPNNLAAWIGWIDTYIKDYKDAKSSLSKASLDETIENFQFEANRAIYQGGLIKLATDRMIEFAVSHPLSKFAIPSSTLALDTYIVTENWTATSALAANLLKTKKWQNAEFSNHLQEVEADSSYKLMEALFRKKDFQLAIAQTEPLIAKFHKTRRAPDFIMLAAQSALQLKMKDSALASFSLLLKDYPTSKASGDALLARAQIAEEYYDFDTALKDYREYLKTTPNEGITKRIYFLEWLSESPTIVCSDPLLNECARYRALSLLRDVKKSADESSEIGGFYIELALNGPKEDRPIFSAVALKYAPSIELHRRLVLLRTLATGWDKLDPMIRLSTLPVLTHLVPENFAKARLELKTAVPMKTVSAKSITHRAEWIKELEKTAGKILELPWNGIRSEVLSELALTYSDFTSTLAASTPPKDLTDPELKEYQKNLNDIIQPFQAKSGEIGEKSKKLAESPTEQVSISYLEKLDPKTDWTFAPQKPQEKTQMRRQIASSEDRLKSLWIEAYSSHSWAKNAFILQELQEKKLVTPSLLSIMKGLTLTASGAKAEAWLEVKPIMDEIKAIDEMKARKTP
ncbi:MAG: tetratricopeptide repeat protein [Bdellovibrionia bacterium]